MGIAAELSWLGMTDEAQTESGEGCGEYVEDVLTYGVFVFALLSNDDDDDTVAARETVRRLGLEPLGLVFHIDEYTLEEGYRAAPEFWCPPDRLATAAENAAEAFATHDPSLKWVVEQVEKSFIFGLDLELSTWEELARAFRSVACQAQRLADKGVDRVTFLAQ